MAKLKALVVNDTKDTTIYVETPTHLTVTLPIRFQNQERLRRISYFEEITFT